METKGDLGNLVRPPRITERLWRRVCVAHPDAMLSVGIITAQMTVRTYDGAAWTDRTAGEHLVGQLALFGYVAHEDALLLRTYHARIPPALVRTLATYRHIERLQLDPVLL